MENWLFLLLCFPIGIVIRNEWVYKQRMKLNKFEQGIHLINNYISYDAMMKHFWIWDIEKLKIKKEL